LSSILKQEEQNTFENFSSKEIFRTDKPTCNNRPGSSKSKSSISENQNIIQTIEDNFNETQILGT